MSAVERKLIFDGQGEQFVWLVWEMSGDKPTLAVICTTDADLDRYVTPNRKSWRKGGAVFVESVMTNHLYGANDMRIASRILRNEG